MKTNKFLLKLFTFFLLLTMTFSFNGCSSSDDNDTDSSCQTFLECQNGTIWDFTNDESIKTYVKFRNNPDIPFEIYEYDFDSNCYEIYQANNNFGDLVVINVIENSKNIYSCNWADSGNHIITYTFNFSNGIINVTQREKDEYDQFVEEVTIILNPAKLDNLVICN